MPPRTGTPDVDHQPIYGETDLEWFIRRQQDHPLVALHDLFDWETRSEHLVRLCRGRLERASYPPSVLFRVLFLAHLYRLSARAVEELVEMNLLPRWFAGLRLDELVPGHAALTLLKQRLLQGEKWCVLEGVFDEMIADAREQGLEPGKVRALRSIGLQANVNAID